MNDASHGDAQAPLIDVIIPVFNGESFIGEAVDSISKQTHRNLRIIIVNDGSTDHSREKIEALACANPNLVFIDMPHGGPSVALNAALRRAKADWLAFLDCDDLWAPSKLTSQLAALQADPSLGICFTQMKEFDDTTAFKTQFRARAEPLDGIGKSSMLCRRSTFTRVGAFNETVKIGDFIEWFNRCKNQGIRHIVLPDVMTFRRIHDSNMSREVTAADYLQVIRLHLKGKKP